MANGHFTPFTEGLLDSEPEPQIIDSGPVVLHATTGDNEPEQEVDDGGDRAGAGE